MANGLTAIDKFQSLRKVIKNWPLVSFDKLGMAKTCLYETRAGLKFRCRSKSTDINELVVVMSGLEYPPKYLKLPSGGVVIDIGASIGDSVVYIDYLNKGQNYRGYAFEPFTDNFSLLQTNCRLNNVGNFQLIQAAISDHDGTVRLDTSGNVDEIKISTSSQGTSVKSCKLSTFCQDHQVKKIDLLKIDAEGAEYPILESDYEFFRKSVQTLLMEYHHISNEKNLDWIIKKLSPDFTVKEIHRGTSNGVIFAKRKSIGDK